MIMPTPRTCLIYGCEEPRASGRGWCGRHLNRFYAHGDPLAGGPEKPTARAEPRDQYGLTRAEREAMWIKQAGRCGLCRRELTRGLPNTPATANVDHDHVTGRVRGLLCRSCNLALGLLGDDPSLLRRAAEWIEGP